MITTSVCGPSKIARLDRNLAEFFSINAVIWIHDLNNPTKIAGRFA
jgi:hypothetical protein